MRRRLPTRVDKIWGDGSDRLVVITGGEPMLQLDPALIDALHDRGFRVAVESNGTFRQSRESTGCASARRPGQTWSSDSGDELKLVWPQEGIDPAASKAGTFDNFLIQPMDCEAREQSLDESIRLVMERPRWRLSLQTHKMIGLP